MSEATQIAASRLNAAEIAYADSLMASREGIGSGNRIRIALVAINGGRYPEILDDVFLQEMRRQQTDLYNARAEYLNLLETPGTVTEPPEV
jgi:hypothetical protein